MDYLQMSHATSGTHSSKWTKWFMNKEQMEKRERQMKEQMDEGQENEDNCLLDDLLDGLQMTGLKIYGWPDR